MENPNKKESEQPRIAVVIPAYNEEKNIVKIIQKVKPLVDEVVVVDDGSIDQTFFLARRQGVKVLKHIINRGQGAALETGNQCALRLGAEIIVHFDADGQYLAEEIKNLVEPIKNGEAEVVFGSRFLEKKSEIPFLKEKIIIPFGRLVNKIFFKVFLIDPQSGFRALSKKALLNFQISNDGSAHCSEIIYKVFKYNLKIKEVAVTVIYQNFGQGILSGKGRGTGGLNIIKDLFLAKLMD